MKEKNQYPIDSLGILHGDFLLDEKNRGEYEA
jgi:hypothetical protein